MRSCSLSVLGKQTAKEITSVDPGRLILAGQGQSDGWIRRLQLERSVRPMSVVVLDIDTQDLLKVSAADNQQPVQTLGTHRPDPPLRVGVRVRRLHRRHEHLGALRAQHVVKRTGELGVAVAEQEPQTPSSSFAKHQQQVAGLLGDPVTVGLAVTPAK
jgi:hypothetical protein